jgi:preprotein translocase subunit SecF
MKLIKDKTTIDFLGPKRRKIALTISALLVIASLTSLATRGLEFGIDFTGGILLEVGYPQAANLEEIRGNLGGAGFADAQVQRFGRDTDVLVRLPPQRSCSRYCRPTAIPSNFVASNSSARR